MRHTQTVLLLTAALAVSAVLSYPAQAAVMSLRAVAVNDVPLEARSNYVQIQPGETLTAELFISDWGSEIDAVWGYAAVVLVDEGGQSGDTGLVAPPSWPVEAWYLDVERPDFIHAGFAPCTCPSNYIYCITEFCPPWTWSSHLLFQNGGTQDPGDGAEFYAGSLVLMASEDACGAFTFEFSIEDQASVLLGLDGTTVVPETVPLHVDVQCAPRVARVCPDNCAIDARYPHDPFNRADNFVWDSIYMTFLGLDVRTMTCADLSTRFVGGAGTPPSCQSVSAIDDSVVRVQLTGPIGVRRWTCIEYLGGQPGYNEICIGMLPGDVDASRIVDAEDLLHLVDHIQFGVNLEPWQCDIDRGGSCNPQDFLALVDMLTGANGFPVPWLGASISVPCPTASLPGTCGGLPLPD